MSGIGRADPATRELAEKIRVALSSAFPFLRRPVQKNLAVLTVGFLQVLGSARSGYGRLSLAALARALPSEGTAHAREKRLHRFLDNPRLDSRGVTDGLARLIFGQKGRGLWPIVFDQTACGSTQALAAGVPFEGRTLPLALYTFSYPWQERAADSQNTLEEVFLLDLESALPEGVRGVFLGDRGYARALLLRRCQLQGRLYVIRGRAGTRVFHGGRACKLRELAGGTTRPIRYRSVLYQAKEQVPVDVIAFRDPRFQEPWWLLVPAGCEKWLPTDTVLRLYRERMQVEQSFRDFKTHLGLRGLHLRVRIAPRLGRVLLAFCIAYSLFLVLGASPQAQQARAHLESPRRTPRHGTQRTLSVLSLAMYMFSHPRWRDTAHRLLCRIADRIHQGRSALPRGPTDRLVARIAAA